MMETCPACLTSIEAFPCKNCGFSKNPTPSGSLPTGTVLRERYRIDGYIAQGGFGSVYRAYDNATERVCALKEMLDSGKASERAARVAQFRQEAQILATLHHPNIASVWDFFEEGGRYYLVMEYLSGGTLSQFSEPLSETQVLPWAVQVAEALEYLHTRNIIYRDLKPDNILLRDGQAVLADFGIARIFKEGQEGDTVRFATIGYAPPEQLSSTIQTTPSSDVYAFGATLYRLLTAQEPEAFVPRGEFFPKFPPLNSLRTDVSTELARILSGTVGFKLQERYTDARAVLEPLRLLLWQHEASRCRCGHKNPLGREKCERCGRTMQTVTAWRASYPDPYRFSARTPFRILWSTALNEPVRGSPLLHDGKLYVSTESGNLYRLDLEGNLLNHTLLPAPSRAAPVMGWDGLYIGTKAGLVTPARVLLPTEEVYAPPLLEPDGLFIMTYSGTLYSFNGAGRERWRYELGGDGILPPLPVGQDLLVITKDGLMARVKRDGSARWRGNVGEKVYGLPALGDERGLLLDARGRLNLLNLEGGQRMMQVGVVGSSYSGLAAHAGGTVAVDTHGQLVGLGADLQERWRAMLPGSVVASPVVAGDYVVVGDRAGGVHIVGLKEGRLETSLPLGREWVSPFIADGNALFGVSREGLVVCIMGQG